MTPPAELPHFDKGPAPQPKAALKQPEAVKPATEQGLAGAGKEVQETCKTPESKQIFSDEFSKTIKDKFDKFSADFKQKFCDDKGQPDLRKIFGLLGLGKLYDQFKPGSSPSASASAAPDTGKTGTPSEKAPVEQAAYKPTFGGKPGQESPSAGPRFDTGKKSGGGKLPERPSSALTGSQFVAQMNRLGNLNSKAVQRQMEQAILAEIARGNIPSFCRPESGKTITMAGPNGTKVSFRTSADYIAIGSDKDYVRVPMTPILAQTLAEKYGWGLPTRDMTKAIYSSADIRLQGIGLVGSYIGDDGKPHPNPSDQAKMQTNEFVEKHQQKIQEQLGASGQARLESGQALVAGHKKDVIISRYAIDHPGSLDFSGLYINGKPVQDNPAHEDTYRDYSHGFRPVDGTVTIAYADGHTESKPYYEALQDPQVARVLNGAEGAIDARRAYQKRITGPSPASSAPPEMVA